MDYMKNWIQNATIGKGASSNTTWKTTPLLFEMILFPGTRNHYTLTLMDTPILYHRMPRMTTMNHFQYEFKTRRLVINVSLLVAIVNAHHQRNIPGNIVTFSTMRIFKEIMQQKHRMSHINLNRNNRRIQMNITQHIRLTP